MEQMALVCVDLPGTMPAPLHDDFFISRYVPSAIEKRGYVFEGVGFVLWNERVAEVIDLSNHRVKSQLKNTTQCAGSLQL
jgi:hypothetical protein